MEPREILEAIDNLEGRITTLRQAVTPDAVAVAVSSGWRTDEGEILGLEGFDARFRGVLAGGTIAALRHEHTASTQAAYDTKLQAEAEAIAKDHDALVGRLSEVTDALQEPPLEDDPQVDSLRQLSALQSLQGRHLADVVKAYVGTSDAKNPTLTRMVETDRDQFKSKAGGRDDVAPLQELLATIKVKRLARIPVAVQELVARAKSLTQPLAVSELLRHLRSGRGVTMQTQTPSRPVEVAS